MGTAVGSIMPTIITTHIASISAKSAPLHARIRSISPMGSDCMVRACTTR